MFAVKVYLERNRSSQPNDRSCFCFFESVLPEREAQQETAAAKTEKRRDSEGQPPPIPEKVVGCFTTQTCSFQH